MIEPINLQTAAQSIQQEQGKGQTVCIPVTMVKIANGDLVTDWIAPYGGRLAALDFVVTTVVATGGKAADLHLEIGPTATTGGVLGLTSANCTPLGKSIAGTAITGQNTFVKGDVLSVVAANVVAFVEGEGVLLISIL